MKPSSYSHVGYGVFVNGSGRAHSSSRNHVPVFNCLMVGTFNIRADFYINKFPPCRTYLDKQYWLVRIEDIYYGWAMRWDGSKTKPKTLEILTRTTLPDSLKGGQSLKIEVLMDWDAKRIKEWASGISWFQSFPWSPQRSDSDKIWDAIKDRGEWSGSTVLDIGCNYGRFSFHAANRGAKVIGVDRWKVINVARTINDHIEMMDVDFRSDWGEEVFDYIFYFSVHHQIDPGYDKLAQTLEGLRKRTRKKLFLELISPPLRGEKSEADVNAMIDGEILTRYKHRVRCMRTLYALEGTA